MIADEATDVAHKEQLCITIRWVDKSFDMYETPVELVNVPQTELETLTTVIKDSLIHLGLPIGQCRGRVYDGASNMSGHSGVAARTHAYNSWNQLQYLFTVLHTALICLKSLGRQSVCTQCSYGDKSANSIFP